MKILTNSRMIQLAICGMAFWLAGCIGQPPTADPGSIQTAIAGTAAALPTYTPYPTHTPYPTYTPYPTSTPGSALPPVPVVYYYFVAVESGSYPAGSVVILPDVLILGPALSDQARSPDPVTNIRAALQAMLADPRNTWISTGVGITSITLEDGAAEVVLDGEYFGVGDINLMAARAQIFLTVFAEASVQSATITLNGENIANLGVSHSLEAKPADYTYTRTEVEAFMAENAYPMAEPGG